MVTQHQQAVGKRGECLCDSRVLHHGVPVSAVKAESLVFFCFTNVSGVAAPVWFFRASVQFQPRLYLLCAPGTELSQMFRSQRSRTSDLDQCMSVRPFQSTRILQRSGGVM